MSAANNIQTSPVIQKPTQIISQNWWITLLQIITISIVTIATVGCIMYFTIATQWRNSTFPGFLISYTMVIDGNEGFGQPWAGHVAGINYLDQIIGIGEIELPEEDYQAARDIFKTELQKHQYGDEITIDVLRKIDVTDADTTGDSTPTETSTVACETPLQTPDACGFERLSFTYPLTNMPLGDFLTYFILPFMTGIISLIVGISLLFLRPRQPKALLVAIYCVSLAVLSTGLINNSTSHLLIPLWLTYTTIGAAAGYIIALVYPTRLTFTYRAPISLAIPPLVAIGVLIIDLRMFYQPANALAYTAVWKLPVIIALISFVTLLLSLAVRRRHITSSIYRDQINTSIIGVGIALVPIIIWLISTLALVFGLDSLVLPLNSVTIMPFFISIPISLAYGVLQYRGFNTDQILSQGITYTIMLSGLVIGYFLLVLGTSIFVSILISTPNVESISGFANTAASNPFLIAVTIFLIAVAFLPFRTRLQSRIDNIYFRDRRQYQNIVETFAREVSSTTNFTDILRLYIDRIKEGVNTRSVFIFLPDEETGNYSAHALSNPQTDIHFAARSDFIKLMQRTHEPIKLTGDVAWESALIPERTNLKILKTRLIIPLRAGRADINGFVIIGQVHEGRDDYSYEQVRFIDNISTQMAISVERAQVVESLERRVRELGVLSQVSQAVNFAVEFDDLLELISSRTQRLLDASHFYIVLKDTNVNQMYYAFFLEFNERFDNYENRRWVATNDIYSKILNSGAPERHDDYTLYIKKLNINSRRVSEDIKAWMGVPLIAGQTNLGVMAIGSTRTGFSYSDEQLKIFGDIGALAATSLDKARLFEETNQRARQLRALNDISRRLQSERDVEKLIGLVTSSAVDILNSEAGSLLLTISEESQDMEFRIVIGGGGEDLIGKRVVAGHGLVGEVAAKGEPVIVNNTQEDARWQGEVNQDGGFHSNAILAVPLMANNVVIGVLEVINKKDGSPFLKDDADLLETFAGQAAIAIENARLFQKTDEQLATQVKELETLERIDADLNRTLDQTEVAAITIKWAVANTGATGAMLGLVNEDEHYPTMHVLHTYGYQPEDYPDGAIDKEWPLDRGIVSRVMRTKRADVVPDTSIDFDYIPSLRGGKSQITVPMLAGKTITAILILEKDHNPPLNILDLAFVQRLTDHATIALENARLFNALESTNKTQSYYMGIGAHEMKNTLAPIRGWTDLLKSGVLGTINDQQANYLGVIKSNADRMQHIIDDLRDFAKSRANELRVDPQPTNLRQSVIDVTLQQFVHQIEEKNQVIVNNISTDLPLIMGDPNRLVQILVNFVSNANKYSPDGATITLDSEIQRDYRNKNGKIIGDFMHISISDTGMGINEEDQKKMFGLYFRTEEAKEAEIPGTGLGMYLTKELITLHGGRVWLESESGVGTTFHFTIPLVPEEESEPAGNTASD